MAAFLTVLARIIPLYLIILLGYLAGSRLKVQKGTVASLLLYILAPVVIFHGTLTVDLTVGLLFLPILFFIIGCTFASLFLFIGSALWTDARKNLLAFTAGSGNTGYFGIPVALALFGENVLGIVVLCTLGLIVYENSFGFYLTARGTYSVRASIGKILKLPTIYAFILGILLNVLWSTPLGTMYEATAANFRGAYSILGMMIIGLGIADMPRWEFDAPFLGLAFLAKFIFWPAITLFIIFLDSRFLHVYTPTVHSIMLLLAATPLAANTVTVATELKTLPEKAALAVLLSTLVGLISIPIAVTAL